MVLKMIIFIVYKPLNIRGREYVLLYYLRHFVGPIMRLKIYIMKNVYLYTIYISKTHKFMQEVLFYFY